MPDDYIIELGDDTEGHVKKLRFVPEGDQEWLDRILAQKPGSAEVSIRLADEDDADTEGHGQGTGNRFRVIVESDDDTEGHAISIHVPSREDADAFRKRLLVTGVLVGSVALGAGAGIGLSSFSANDAGSAGAAAVSGAEGSAWTADERAGLAAAAATEAGSGSAWTADERAGLSAAAATEAGSGSAWTADERAGLGAAAAGGEEESTDDAETSGGLQPR